MKNTICLLLFSLFSQSIFGQETSSKIEISGYISNMQSTMFQDINSDWLNDNLIHNRLNFFWYPSEKISFSAQVRNRFFWGESVKMTPNYATFFEKDAGFQNLTCNVFSEKSFFLNTSIDRLWAQFSSDNWELKVGRQRINWSKSMVWNPNDIFNNYSFFDFDYPERPGSDAIRLQYCTGRTSSIELVVKTDSTKNVTTAALFAFNTADYDFQFLSGLLNNQDWVLGAGWSGSIKDVAFRGEMTYLQPKQNFSDTTGLFLMSVSLQYSITGANFTLEGLYNQNAGSRIADFNQLYTQTLGVKQLSFSDFSLFASATVQFSPLFSATLSAMYYPDLKGYFVSPSVVYSLSNNLTVSLFVQFFSAEFRASERENIGMAYLRFKYSF